MYSQATELSNRLRLPIFKISPFGRVIHFACYNGREAPTYSLLAHPNIHVNQKTTGGSNSLLEGLVNGKTACVRLLLRDARVTVNEPDNNGCTPLWCAAINGRLEVIKWWIASGREMELGQPGNEKNDAIGGAKKGGRTKVVSLLERFRDHPEKTKHEVRVELGCFEKEMFALVLFLCDGLLEIKRRGRAGREAARFLRIASRLPLELQT